MRSNRNCRVPIEVFVHRMSKYVYEMKKLHHESILRKFTSNLSKAPEKFTNIIPRSQCSSCYRYVFANLQWSIKNNEEVHLFFARGQSERYTQTFPSTSRADSGPLSKLTTFAFSPIHLTPRTRIYMLHRYTYTHSGKKSRARE